jgi:hypothetical protein|tara:strand:- start:306 stop:512 length:207 start_codon:yes stop_codon:yes gene_type:complete
MKTKVKTFHTVLPLFGNEEEYSLDDDLTKWIEDYNPVIVDIKYSVSGNKHYGGIGSVLILYKEKKGKK